MPHSFDNSMTTGMAVCVFVLTTFN
jgi:hypothetical protein